MTSKQVDIVALGKDLEVIYQAFTVVDPASVLNGAVNDNEINQLMLEIVAVGEKHGIRFPRVLLPYSLNKFCILTAILRF
jgi:aarF domain-containing kinase